MNSFKSFFGRKSPFMFYGVFLVFYNSKPIKDPKSINQISLSENNSRNMGDMFQFLDIHRPSNLEIP